ncbi:hypothetical protein CTRI78_v006288 [Colletotrichum trifolii]|uniref:Secreted protein n=1 Tax=Colletotrichum trifolii TaxID=5466 RepID=A0A4R8RFZ0_COLTR|nr:hypothetical protein CTRI78_v006288 [Colletotrichum trifolii]
MRGLVSRLVVPSLLLAPSFAQITPLVCEPVTVACSGTDDCVAKGQPGAFPCPAGSGQNDADCWVAGPIGSPETVRCWCCKPRPAA